MSSDETALPQPMIGIGQVRHARLRPAVNRFAYGTYFLMLPMRRLRSAPSAPLARNRFGLVSFHDADHGDGGPDSLAWLEALLAREGVDDALGEVWLHCYPRVLGHTFKPVSLWYCHRADDTLAAVVAEVNNTFGERHCYLLRGPDLAWGREQRVSKAFHVSPFCDVAGSYRFRFMRTSAHLVSASARTAAHEHPQAAANARRRPSRGLSQLGSGPALTHERTVVRIDHDDVDGPLIQTSVSGDLAPITPARIRAAFFGMPLMTLAVIARIHWQAARLWMRRVPIFRKPEPPRALVSRQT